MGEFLRVDRRLFLARFGKGVMAMAILGACGPESGASASTSTSAGSAVGTQDPESSPGRYGTTTTCTSTTGTSTTAASSTTTGSTNLAQFLRVDLGFVSAYIVVRGSEAAVVDTGVSGSEGSIETALGNLGLGWDAVGHVILTHHHRDHAGSLPAVMTAAAAATGYIGTADLDNVSAGRDLVALNDGDEVFGMSVIATPGHTAGHISLLDSLASVLIAGDALNGGSQGVEGPNPQFSEDHNQAIETVGTIAGFEFETIYFGHGEPVLAGAAGQVADLAASL